MKHRKLVREVGLVSLALTCRVSRARLPSQPEAQSQNHRSNAVKQSRKWTINSNKATSSPKVSKITTSRASRLRRGWLGVLLGKQLLRPKWTQPTSSSPPTTPSTRRIIPIRAHLITKEHQQCLPHLPTARNVSKLLKLVLLRPLMQTWPRPSSY